MIDLSNSKPTRDYDLLPAGEYKGVLEDYEKRTSAKGKIYYNLKYRLENNRVVFSTIIDANDTENYSLKAIEVTKAKMYGMLEAVGSDVFSFNTMEEFLDEIVNIPVIIVVNIEEYEGKKKNGVKYIKADTSKVVKNDDIPF